MNLGFFFGIAVAFGIVIGFDIDNMLAGALLGFGCSGLGILIGGR